MELSEHAREEDRYTSDGSAGASGFHRGDTNASSTLPPFREAYADLMDDFGYIGNAVEFEGPDANEWWEWDTDEWTEVPTECYESSPETPDFIIAGGTPLTETTIKTNRTSGQRTEADQLVPKLAIHQSTPRTKMGRNAPLSSRSTPRSNSRGSPRSTPRGVAPNTKAPGWSLPIDPTGTPRHGTPRVTETKIPLMESPRPPPASHSTPRDRGTKRPSRSVTSKFIDSGQLGTSDALDDGLQRHFESNHVPNRKHGIAGDQPGKAEPVVTDRVPRSAMAHSGRSPVRNASVHGPRFVDEEGPPSSKRETPVVRRRTTASTTQQSSGRGSERRASQGRASQGRASQGHRLTHDRGSPDRRENDGSGTKRATSGHRQRVNSHYDTGHRTSGGVTRFSQGTSGQGSVTNGHEVITRSSQGGVSRSSHGAVTRASHGSKTSHGSRGSQGHRGATSDRSTEQPRSRSPVSGVSSHSMPRSISPDSTRRDRSVERAALPRRRHREDHPLDRPPHLESSDVDRSSMGRSSIGRSRRRNASPHAMQSSELIETNDTLATRRKRFQSSPQVMFVGKEDYGKGNDNRGDYDNRRRREHRTRAASAWDLKSKHAEDHHRLDYGDGRGRRSQGRKDVDTIDLGKWSEANRESVTVASTTVGGSTVGSAPKSHIKSSVMFAGDEPVKLERKTSPVKPALKKGPSKKELPRTSSFGVGFAIDSPRDSARSYGDSTSERVRVPELCLSKVKSETSKPQDIEPPDNMFTYEPLPSPLYRRTKVSSTKSPTTTSPVTTNPVTSPATTSTATKSHLTKMVTLEKVNNDLGVLAAVGDNTFSAALQTKPLSFPAGGLRAAGSSHFESCHSATTSFISSRG